MIVCLSLAVIAACAANPGRPTGRTSGSAPGHVPAPRHDRADTSLVVPPATVGRTVDGRPYFLHLPPSTTRFELLLVLHGLANSPATVARQTGFTSLASRHGYAVAYPLGFDRSWNAGGCCGATSADDTSYLVDVVRDIERTSRVDRRHVFVVGFSNGGMMALRAECERPDIFTAAGAMSAALMVRCAPLPGVASRPLSICQYAGTADRVVPAPGGFSRYLHIRIPPLSSENARLPTGSRLSISIISGLGHDWATRRNSGVDATSGLVACMQSSPRTNGWAPG